MSLHGLHLVSHFLVADGSGRDSIVMLDGGWKHGRRGAYGIPAPVVPIKPFETDDRSTDVYGMKPKAGVNYREAARLMKTAPMPEDWHKASYRAKGFSILHLPKSGSSEKAKASEEAKTSKEKPPSRSKSSPTLSTRAQSLQKQQKRTFRSRETIGNLADWSHQTHTRVAARNKP
mmetsp:Transcript_64295/g.114235  ORF Transcript_64295/g.114235 Transcript_64295/m.114235 type:complete len:175 (+) Transcript_64295:65-589(+)